MRDGRVDARVGRPNARAGAHGDDEEEAAVVGEEREDAPVRREAMDDEVDAFGEDVTVLRRLPGFHVQRVDERTARVDEHTRADLELVAGRHIARAHPPFFVATLARENLYVVCGDATVIDRLAHEVPDEARVVVVQVRVAVLESAVDLRAVDDRLLAFDRLAREVARAAREETADEPVEPRAEHEQP